MREDRVLRKRATHKANGAIMTVPLKKVRKRGKHSSMSTNTKSGSAVISMEAMKGL